MLVLLSSGQTGIERGACRAAIAAGLAIEGFMPLDGRDELGPIPSEIARLLRPHMERGHRPAVRANVGIASGVLLVVPDASAPDRFTAMTVIRQAVRAAGCGSLVVDASTNLEDVTRWARSLPEQEGVTRLFVTGPRGTRWPDGESVARRLVSAIAMSQ
jgi:hypothetical protein